MRPTDYTDPEQLRRMLSKTAFHQEAESVLRTVKSICILLLKLKKQYFSSKLAQAWSAC